MKNVILGTGLIIVATFMLLQLSRYSYLSGDIAIEIVIGVIALAFFALGLFLARKYFNKPKSQEVDEQAIRKLGISKRELEVLQSIAIGLSNAEIANKLFVSESTIKTHISNLLVKLDAKRRTEAVNIAREKRVIG